MAGTIVVCEGQRWSAASWLFDWVVDFLAIAVDNFTLSERLRGVIQENIGWLDLPDLSASERQDILRIVRLELLPAAQNALPASVPNYEATLVHLESLVDIACRCEAKPPKVDRTCDSPPI